MKIALLLSLFLLTLVTGCSKLSIGVYWADTFVSSQLDDYFHLDTNAKEATKAEFRRILAQVRAEDFPQKAKLLREFSTRLDDPSPITEAQLEDWWRKTEKSFRTSIARFEPLAQKLVEEERSKGFARFDEEFLKTSTKRKKKDPAQEGKKRMERVVAETIEELNPEQTKWLESFLQTSPFPYLAFESSREQVFRQFQSVRNDPQKTKIFLQNYFQNWNGLQSKEYLSANAEYQKNFRQLIVRILASASPEQKKSIQKNFLGRAKELEDLKL